MISENLIDAIEDVWQAIGPDCLMMDDEMSNRDAIELCLDANRLETFGFPAAYDEFQLLMDEHGYSATLDLIAANVRVN